MVLSLGMVLPGYVNDPTKEPSAACLTPSVTPDLRPDARYLPRPLAPTPAGSAISYGLKLLCPVALTPSYS
eukprot:1191451-Rhodomonas_salina.2